MWVGGEKSTMWYGCPNNCVCWSRQQLCMEQNLQVYIDRYACMMVWDDLLLKICIRTHRLSTGYWAACHSIFHTPSCS